MRREQSGESEPQLDDGMGDGRPTLVHRPRPRRIETRDRREDREREEAGSPRPQGDLERRVARLEVMLGTLTESLERAVADAQRLLDEQLPEHLAELDERIDRLERVDAVVERLRDASASAVSEVDQVGGRLAAAVDRLGAVDHDLEQHRGQLDATLAADRQALVEQVLTDVLDRLVDRLPRRARRRVAAELASQQPAAPLPTQSPSASSDPVLSDTETSASVPASAGVADPRIGDPSTGGAAMESQPDTADAAAPASPARDEMPEPSDVPALQEDRPRSRAGIVAARTMLYETVLEVPGIGPARAARLVEAFGDLDELAAVPPEQVADLASLPGELAEAVTGHARGTHRP